MLLLEHSDVDPLLTSSTRQLLLHEHLAGVDDHN